MRDLILVWLIRLLWYYIGIVIIFGIVIIAQSQINTQTYFQIFHICIITHSENLKQRVYGTSLEVWWRLCASTAWGIGSISMIVRELRSHMPWGSGKKINQSIKQRVYVRGNRLIMIQIREVYIYIKTDFQQYISNHSRVKWITFCYVQAVVMHRVTGML